MYDRHLRSFHEPVATLIARQIFRSDASSLIQRFELVVHDTNGCHFCKPSCDAGNSLVVEPAFRHHPYPLVGTCPRGNDPNALMFCISPRLP